MRIQVPLLALVPCALGLAIRDTSTVATSPDNYRYIVETGKNALVPHDVTLPDGREGTIWMHPSFSVKTGQTSTPDDDDAAEKLEVTKTTKDEVTKRLDWSPNTTNDDECGSSSFRSVTTPGSPLVEDCDFIASFLSVTNNFGYWVASAGLDLKINGDWCRVMIHNSCVYGIRSGNVFGVRIGSSDIRDTTNQAIQEFQWNGYIGAQGEMRCNTAWGQGVNDQADVKWAIFRGN